MNILDIQKLAIPGICVIRFSRFHDQRGFFTEPMRVSNIQAGGFVDTAIRWDQMNESLSRAGTIRGLHFQWNPLMSKLVRTIWGHMIDIALDVRAGSPTFGKLIAFDMPAIDVSESYDQWIWIPGGVAHGNYFLSETRIEYLCMGEYNQSCEAGISPLATDIDWSLCDMRLKDQIQAELRSPSLIISEKDRNAFSFRRWTDNPDSSRIMFQ